MGRRLTVLGSGTSTGVPVFGCDCRVCRSEDRRNQRTRASVLWELPGGNLLIDTAPEMRLQLLRERVDRVHAIAYTHAHADHLFGLDDARLFPRAIGGPVPVYCEGNVEEAIRRAFSYAFSAEAEGISPGGIPKLRFEMVWPGVEFEVLGARVTPLRLMHGRLPVLGFRIGGVAYCTDVSSIPEETWPLLDGLDVLILDALRFERHPTHFSLSEALEVVERVRPRRAILTHLAHNYDHAIVESTLPAGVGLAYDGLWVELNTE